MSFIKVENFSENSNIKIVSLNRPEVKNAFHPEMIAEITNFFKSESSASGTQLIVLKGEGTAFCAGADLNWMKDMVNYSFAQNLADSEKLWDMFESLQSCSVPVVGVAQGAVFGGALGLLACCDYVYLEEKTQLCFSEVKLGLSPAVISGFISRKIQDAFYRPYMLSAEVFGVTESLRMGLAHQTYKEQLNLSEMVKRFSVNGNEAMRETKKLLNSLLTVSQRQEQKAICTRVISERRTSAEGQQRLNKFLSRTN